jgi:hypothetical protein
VVLPTPTPPADPLLFAAKLIDSAAQAATWVWFICGSLIFFIVAGYVAGLGLQSRDSDRFELIEFSETKASGPQGSDDSESGDEYWPSSLP